MCYAAYVIEWWLNESTKKVRLFTQKESMGSPLTLSLRVNLLKNISSIKKPLEIKVVEIL